MASVSGGNGNSTPPDLSGYVTRTDFDAAVPGRFTNLTDVYSNGIPSARGDQWMDDGTGKIMRVPNAIWGTSGKLSRLLAGTGGSTPPSIVNTALPAGQVGVAYSATITATGGALDSASKYDWKIVVNSVPGGATAATLPTGMTFAPAAGSGSATSPYGRAVSATLSGTLTSAVSGTYGVTITVQDALENTASLTANIIIAASAAPLTFTMPALPNAKCGTAYSQSLASAVSGGTGPYTFTAASFADGLAINTAGLITGTCTTPQQVAISVTVTDGATSLTRSGTILIESQATVRFDLADLIGPEGGSYTYAGLAGRPSTVTPSYNVAQINARVGSALGAGVPVGKGGLYSSQGTIESPGTIMIGAAAGATTSGTLIFGQNLNNWDCGNVIFKLAANQPTNAPVINGVANLNNSGARILQTNNLSLAQRYLRIDGNSGNQITSDATNPVWGFYCFGITDSTTTGPRYGTYIISNLRGSQADSSTTSSPVDNNIHTEVFHMQSVSGYGGDNMIVTVENTDGVTPVTKTASGCAWQYTFNPDLVTNLKITGLNVNHGFGTYAGGTFQIAAGSSMTNCSHGFNIETGVGTSKGAYPTKSVTIGTNGGGVDQVTTTGCDYGIICIANNTGNAYAAASIQLGVVRTYGHTSIDDDIPFGHSQTAPVTGYFLTDMHVTDPITSAIKINTTYNSTIHTTVADKITLTTCTVHWTGTVGRQMRPGTTDALGYFPAGAATGVTGRLTVV